MSLLALGTVALLAGASALAQRPRPEIDTLTVASVGMYLSRIRHRGFSKETDRVQDVVQKVKDGDAKAIRWAGRCIAQHPAVLAAHVDVVVPVPRSDRRRPSLLPLARAIIDCHTGSSAEDLLERVEAVPSSRERRLHGRGGIGLEAHLASMRVTGSLPPGASVLLVDDVVTAGGTLLAAANALRAAGHEGPILGAVLAWYEPDPGRIRDAWGNRIHTVTLADVERQARRGRKGSGLRRVGPGATSEEPDWIDGQITLDDGTLVRFDVAPWFHLATEKDLFELEQVDYVGGWARGDDDVTQRLVFLLERVDLKEYDSLRGVLRRARQENRPFYVKIDIGRARDWIRRFKPEFAKQFIWHWQGGSLLRRVGPEAVDPEEPPEPLRMGVMFRSPAHRADEKRTILVVFGGSVDNPSVRLTNLEGQTIRIWWHTQIDELASATSGIPIAFGGGFYRLQPAHQHLIARASKRFDRSGL